MLSAQVMTTHFLTFNWLHVINKSNVRQINPITNYLQKYYRMKKNFFKASSIINRVGFSIKNRHTFLGVLRVYFS